MLKEKIPKVETFSFAPKLIPENPGKKNFSKLLWYKLPLIQYRKGYSKILKKFYDVITKDFM